VSYTILHTVPKTGEIESYKEFQNAWLWGFSCWEYLAKRYLNMEGYQVLMNADKVWALFKGNRVHDYHKTCLGATFDKVMVRRVDLPKISDAFDAFGRQAKLERWCEMATAIEDLILSGKEFEAVCWTVTTVTDAWWIAAPDPDDDYRRYDISKDTGHWFLFDEVQTQ
jgi:hypothetical protein